MQVNGRVRAQVVVPADSDEDAVVEAARANANVARHLDGGSLRKTILVPGKLINLVVG